MTREGELSTGTDREESWPQSPYVHALRFRILTPLYDTVVGLGMREKRIKTTLLQQASIVGGTRVLDLGCGTGTLAILGCLLHPAAEFTAIDGDPAILSIAERKARAAGVSVRFAHGMADAIPFPDGAFDRVVSSLLFHHLTIDQKRRSFEEIRRVLAPRGELHVADFGKPEGRYARIASKMLSRFDGVETTRDNFEGRLPEILESAGFTARAGHRIQTTFGTLQFISASPRAAGG
ncbi:MAG: class I SAM-dependent methyltransferase [Acidobacteria bacterium]|nr:class I SAM-dependent methyltransferase [Acidobacteriota bacterium]